MIATTYNAQTVYLLDDAPNWQAGVEASFELLRRDTDGLSQRGTRRAFSESLRVSEFKYTATRRGADVRALVGALRGLTDAPVVVPFWPAVTTWANRAANPLQGGLMVVWKADWSQFAIYASDDAEPVWPAAGDSWAPALWGQLANAPELRLADARTMTSFAVEFAENSPAAYALTATEVTWPDGPQPTGHAEAPHLCEFRPNWREGIRQTFRVTVDRERIGFRRETADTFYSQLVTQICERGFTLGRPADVGRFLRFFQDHAAGDAFWLAAGFESARLSADLGPADTVLPVEDTVAVLAGDYLALVTGVGGLAPVQVTGLTADELTVATAPGAHAAGTVLTPLLLVCLERPRLDVTWRAPRLASARLVLREVPEEVSPAADESLGETLGKLPTKVYLYEFVRNYGNGTTATTRWTSFERDVEWNGYTWTSKPISHGEIRQSLNLERESVDLTTFFSADNPLLGDVTLESEGTLCCVIRELQLTA
jgi:hypothetical protein